MISKNELTRHINNIKVFRAYSYAELLRQAVLFPVDYYIRGGKSCYPLNIAFFVTLRCNARCSMCNLKDILNDRGQTEPSLAQIEGFLDGIKGVKPSIILFGGEPFVRSDLVDIVSAIKRRGFSCGVFTNGTLLNDNMIRDLCILKMDFIVFSIQGTRDIHDKIVGLRGAYDKLFHSMEQFTHHEGCHTKVITHTMITEENLSDLTTLTYEIKKADVDLIRFGHPTYFAPGDAEKNKKVCEKFFPEGVISEMSYFYNADHKIEEYYKAIRDLKNTFNGGITFVPELDLDEIRDWYSSDFKTTRKCRFLWRGLFIYPNGDVYPCESLKYPLGNIYEKEFKDIWNSDKYVHLRKILRKRLLPACVRCCKL